ncbi:glycosyltransferase family 2 protein [Marivibrio halodurans]|uniref:Glycosyltransferase family 2 protein n=1 Tax=Marivibrio halodurans TaxID=2039722 RepID=A0A8J7V5A0_9PROT|nr:glycosyltransferase family 2 protein [Marivibrio halodurans]MBP5858649.1 glycosyltransferase family 2 protein [Marivibrio halodurans]
MIAVVIPCYRETAAVLSVIAAVPPPVDRIYCVDDGCPDGTGDLVERECADPRVTVLRHARNRGVGGAMATGYLQALADGAEIIVKIDGDGQMAPRLIPAFVEPIRAGRADYVKGNRFFRPETVAAMPTVRLVGNAVLSFLNKFSSGYWQIFDPTNGFTAIHARVLWLMPLERIDRSYLFETEMLYRLGTLRAVVLDLPVKPVYGDERSHLVPHRMILPLLGRHGANFLRRIVYCYFLRDFSVASLEWLLGPALILFGLIFGASAWASAGASGVEATAGTVMLAALPIILGVQALLSALNFDSANQPRTPIHPTLGDLLDETEEGVGPRTASPTNPETDHGAGGDGGE